VRYVQHLEEEKLLRLQTSSSDKQKLWNKFCGTWKYWTSLQKLTRDSSLYAEISVIGKKWTWQSWLCCSLPRRERGSAGSSSEFAEHIGRDLRSSGWSRRGGRGPGSRHRIEPRWRQAWSRRWSRRRDWKERRRVSLYFHFVLVNECAVFLQVHVSINLSNYTFLPQFQKLISSLSLFIFASVSQTSFLLDKLHI